MRASLFAKLLGGPLEHSERSNSGGNSPQASGQDENAAHYFGGDTKLARSRRIRAANLCKRFIENYGDKEVTLLRAPARINILGEHVDYVSYLPTASIPCASEEFDMLMLVAGSPQPRVRGSSQLVGMKPFTFALTEFALSPENESAELAWERMLSREGAPAHDWSNYVRGAVAHARCQFRGRAQLQEKALRGFDFVVDSVIPSGGGASSSSALTCLSGYALRLVNSLPFDRDELAISSSRAEWFVGTRGGALDHLTICLAKRNYALHLSYSTLEVLPLILPTSAHKWVTFFTHPAEKGSEVLLQYNERAVVSRIIIPALIEDWAKTRPSVYREWQSAVQGLPSGSLISGSFISGSGAVTARILEMLENLPLHFSLEELGKNFPHAFEQAQRSFLRLVKERGAEPLKVRSRALHHVGEILRTQQAQDMLAPSSGLTADEQLQRLGELLNESHASLRDNYEVSIPEVESLRSMLAAHQLVLGARIMGGGFGGNVLALVREEGVDAVVEAAQDGFYGPRGRDGAAEGAIRVSSPGEGIGCVLPPAGGVVAQDHNGTRVSLAREVLSRNARFAALEFQEDGSILATSDGSRFASGDELLAATNRNRECLATLLDGFPDLSEIADVQPIIVAAGKGTRACASGLSVPKSVAPIHGVPTVAHVFDAVLEACPRARVPIVIVSEEVRGVVTEALGARTFKIVVQPVARGTGDAVLCAEAEIAQHEGHSLVVWGTQPVIQVQTFKRMLALAALFPDYQMFVPTAFGEKPYAPLLRKAGGEVATAVETHLQKAHTVPFGETNLGLFTLKSQSMLRILGGLRAASFDAATGVYRRPGGELGFPNELISALAQEPSGVLASPLADIRETQGIKCKDDVALCERYRAELR